MEFQFHIADRRWLNKIVWCFDVVDNSENKVGNEEGLNSKIKFPLFLESGLYHNPKILQMIFSWIFFKLL